MHILVTVFDAADRREEPAELAFYQTISCPRVGEELAVDTFREDARDISFKGRVVRVARQISLAIDGGPHVSREDVHVFIDLVT